MRKILPALLVSFGLALFLVHVAEDVPNDAQGFLGAVKHASYGFMVLPTLLHLLFGSGWDSPPSGALLFVPLWVQCFPLVWAALTLVGPLYRAFKRPAQVDDDYS